ncbi:hypothetical protein [Thalassospira alkalitolerans]|uniref:hypothetical protein n=1 Tax=Thalassospira alkalitolerans TaxID=1293890 RepID=UPI003AA7D2B7
MTYTIHARNEHQWAVGFIALLHEAQSVDEINKLREIHMNTARAVKKTRPDIMNHVAQQVANRRSMLAQAPGG